jgi:hypothetical protein
MKIAKLFDKLLRNLNIFIKKPFFFCVMISEFYYKVKKMMS